MMHMSSCNCSTCKQHHCLLLCAHMCCVFTCQILYMSIHIFKPYSYTIHGCGVDVICIQITYTEFTVTYSI
jgi:hypothetical protein